MVGTSDLTYYDAKIIQFTGKANDSLKFSDFIRIKLIAGSGIDINECLFSSFVTA